MAEADPSLGLEMTSNYVDYILRQGSAPAAPRSKNVKVQ
jgi:hypothetical protein